MILHEFQAKELLFQYGLLSTKPEAISDIKAIQNLPDSFENKNLVAKAQVYAGGRGKAGGIKMCSNLKEVTEFAQNMLGKKLITNQTDSTGQTISYILVEECVEIEREFYLSILIDRSSKEVVIIASKEGGMDIEEVAKTNPEKIIRTPVDIVAKLQPWQIRKIAFALELPKESTSELGKLLAKLVAIFFEKDLLLLEINPLVLTPNKELICLDAKMEIDDNAMYRQKELLAIKDKSQFNPKELEASEIGLNYISMEGSIGCMVNGAGLAMATMDSIKFNGSSPANFLDVGGTATSDRVREAIRIILSDSNVKGILINIFGGIVKCDLIALGLIEAIKEIGLSIPVVVRLEGNNAQKGKDELENSGLKVVGETDLDKAVKKIIELTRG